MKRRPRGPRWSTAYHEAGHAVAALRHHVRLRRVEIMSSGSGITRHRNLLAGRHVDADAGAANRDRMEHLVIVTLAGGVAERRHDRRGYRARHDELDRSEAADLISYFTSNAAELDAYYRLLEIRAEQFVKLGWREITAVATALHKASWLSAKEVRRVVAAERVSKQVAEQT